MSDSKTEARENEVRLLITTKLHKRDSVVVKMILRLENVLQIESIKDKNCIYWDLMYRQSSFHMC